jgi:hypothetical protein
VLVGTNNATGYAVTIQMAADAQNEAATPATYGQSLIGAVVAETVKTVTPVVGAGVALTANTWGYNTTAGATFSPVPKNQTDQSGTAATLYTSAAAGQATTTVTFGVKVDATLPSDTYSNYVLYTASANP